MYNVIITIYVVENGFIIKNGNPESLISKQYVARSKEDLLQVIETLAETLSTKFEKIKPARKGVE